MSGYFAIHRGLFKHSLFKKEPFTEVQAWIWLISEAAWQEDSRRIGRATVDLKRGQLAHATRFMAKAWMWPESRVRRFLARLAKEHMIDALATRTSTQITICNYDEYQPTRRTGDAQNDTETTHSRRKLEEDNNRKKELEAPEEAPEDVVVGLYAFKGRLVKINPEQFERWRKNYESIELRDELALADDYYFENPPKDGKWFYKVAAWLDRSNKRARDLKKAELRARGDAW